MTKLKAALIHLGISSFALIVLALVTILVLYPDPHYKYEGVLEILKLIVLVDVIIGPVLTFIVFKSGKPTLKIDLSVIAFVQISAFVYGAFIIYSQYPAYLVYSNGSIVTVPASAIDQDLISDPALKSHWLEGPKLVMSRLPEDPTRQMEYLMSSGREGKNLTDYPELYQTYNPGILALQRSALDIDMLRQVESKRKVIDEFLDSRGLSEREVLLLSLVSKYKVNVIVLARSTGMPIGYLDIAPN